MARNKKRLRRKGNKTGQDLIKALQASPRRDINLAPARGAIAVLNPWTDSPPTDQA